MTEKIDLSSLLAGPGADLNLKNIAKRIKDGDIFAYPTETIYGIGGSADRADVQEKIEKIKNRESGNPLIILAGSKKIFIDFGVHFSPIADVLAHHFWPGPLTMVLPFGNKGQTIGVRVSDHPFVCAINALLTIPIYSTSANISGKPYVNDPDEIFRIFKDQIGFMIDAGVLPPSPPSTVVSILADSRIALLRDGAIPKEKVMSVVIDSLQGKS
jgi:L-threonylcarbamoyladenylate synthase